MLVSIVVAMALNRTIGKSGALPWKLPGDLKYFKSLTVGHCIIMGRKTFDSIGAPLPDRQNIVVTRNSAFSGTNIKSFPSLSAAIDTCKQANESEVMIIGGGEVYAQSLPFTKKIYLTQIHAYINGDTFFPQLDMENWIETKNTFQRNSEGPSYSFITLEHKKNKFEEL